MTFGRVAEALPRAIRLVGWPKLVIFFFFFFLCRFSTLYLIVFIFLRYDQVSLTHVIRLVGWPKSVISSLSLSIAAQQFQRGWS